MNLSLGIRIAKFIEHRSVRKFRTKVFGGGVICRFILCVSLHVQKSINNKDYPLSPCHGENGLKGL